MTDQDYATEQAPRDQQDPGAQPPRPMAGQRFSRGAIITTVVAVVGGLTLLGAAGLRLVTGFGYSVSAVSYSDESYSEPVPDDFSDYFGADGVDALTIDATNARVAVAFADTEEIAVETVDADGDTIDGWTATQSGTKLKISGGDNWYCEGDCSQPENQQVVTITLPQSIAEQGGFGIDAQIEAGTLSVEGSYDSVELAAEGSDVTFSGSASKLGLSVSDSAAKIETVDTQKAEIESTSGTIELTFDGAAPKRFELESYMSKIDATLPNAKYWIEELDALAGVNNGLQLSKQAKHRIWIDATASDIRLR